MIDTRQVFEFRVDSISGKISLFHLGSEKIPISQRVA